MSDLTQLGGPGDPETTLMVARWAAASSSDNLPSPQRFAPIEALAGRFVPLPDRVCSTTWLLEASNYQSDVVLDLSRGRRAAERRVLPFSRERVDLPLGAIRAQGVAHTL